MRSVTRRRCQRVKSLLQATGLTASTSLVAMIKLAIDASMISQHGVDELAAFAFVFPVLFLNISVGRGIYVATAAAFAGGRMVKGNSVFRPPLLAALCFSLLLGFCALLVLQLTLSEGLTYLGASAYLGRLSSYFSVWLWSIPLLFISSNTFAIMRNLGYLSSASAITIVATCVGLALSFALIPTYGIVGSAYSTLVTSAASTVLSVLFVFARSAKSSLLAWRLRDSLLVARTVLAIGAPVLLSNLLLFVYQSFVTRLIAGFGAHATAAYALIGRVEQVLFVIQAAFVTIAIPQLVHHFSRQRYIHAAAFSMLIKRLMFATAGAFGVVALVSAHGIATAFAPSHASQEVVMVYLCIGPLTICFQGLFGLATTSLNLMGAARESLLCSALAYCIVSPAIAWLFSLSPSFNLLIVGLAVANVLTGILAWIYMKGKLCRRMNHAPAVSKRSVAG